ncbi:single-strand DNA-binding protein [Micromonospora pattaloongensis]|uniref:Single-strand DNA-binding protein n=1 Tax=Micromonospora pattaloongensis TaxID=405436 RepID=A0A1H3SUL2_9ACTN|nr:single-stranded DNA-binding protein [Micromonospora pattaloongensis]SDZ41215.1 single-strand DNA-binding protein [Micromonospora pattaloongensis]
MFDTNVTIVGNVLTAPEWRRTSQTNTLVANFKVASTSRRLDRENGRWVDGNSLRVRVNCWRKLAEGVASSVMVGDPVVVVGRLYTRDWIDGEGNQRTLYELEAVAVGHDLSRGRGRFVRNRPAMATSAVEDAEAETRVHGEVTAAVPDEEAPARADEHLFDDDGDPDFAVPSAGPSVAPLVGYDPLAELRGGGGFDDGGAEVLAQAEPVPDQPAEKLPEQPAEETETAGDPPALPGGPETPADPGELDPPAEEPDGAAGGRGRRGRARTPVPA